MRADEDLGWPRRGYAWYVVVLLMIAYAFSIVDRIGLGLLVQPIEADLHITDSQIGLLQGLSFAIFYCLLGLPIGVMTDYLNRRNLAAAGIALWSVAAMACGLAGSFAGLFLARIGIGAGEATLNPAASSLISDYFPPKARSRAFAVFVLGTSIGSGLAFILGGVAIDFANRLRDTGPAWLATFPAWKIVFFLIGAPGLIFAALFRLTVREPPRRDRAGAGGKVSLAPLRAQLATEWRSYVSVIGGAVLNAISVYALLNWLPTLLIRVQGWSPPEVGKTLGLSVLPFGLVSALSAGWIIAWLEKRGREDAAIIAALVQTAWFAVAALITCLAPTPTGSLIGFCLFTSIGNWGPVSTLTALNRITPNEMRGQVVAIYTLLSGLIAQSLGPYMVGFMSDHVFGQPGGLGASMAVVFAVSGTLAFIVLAWGRTEFRGAARRMPD